MSKRELIEPTPGDKRYARRDDEGRSRAQDQKRDARNEAPKGQGDRGDRRN